MSTSQYTRQSPPYTSRMQHDTSASSDQNSSHNSSPGAGRSRSFSITDILSDNTGSSRKRSSSSESSSGNNQDKIARVDGIVSSSPSSSSSSSTHATGQHLLPLVQAGSVVMSPVNACLSLSPALSQPSTTPLVPGYYHPLSMVAATPVPSTSYYPTFSPVTQHIRGGQSGPVYTALSTNSGCSQLQENMADMKLASQLNDSNTSSNDNSLGFTEEDINTVSSREANGPAVTTTFKKTVPEEVNPHTPIDTTPESAHRQTTAYLPNFFQWSPLQLPASNACTFSPSIFLTRPNSGIHPVSRTSPQERTSPNNKEGGANQFMTSTPIRYGEKIYFVSPSRVHSPIASAERHKGHQEQQISSSEYSSSSDSEMPLLHRPRVPRRRPPRARTSLNPLLENTNPAPPAISAPPRSLPLSTAPPSSLLTSFKLPQSSSNAYPSFSDSGVVSDASSMYRNSYYPLMEVSPQPQVHYTQLQKTPVKSRLERGMGYAKMCGNSPVTDHLNKTGQIQSIPPWFVCSDKKSDGKRLRLTEAINKSLSDSVTHKNLQLPAEWQKLAYGQTEDQKNLTRKARNFLKGRPRVLKFGNTVCNNKSVH